MKPFNGAKKMNTHTDGSTDTRMVIRGSAFGANNNGPLSGIILEPMEFGSAKEARQAVVDAVRGERYGYAEGTVSLVRIDADGEEEDVAHCQVIGRAPGDGTKVLPLRVCLLALGLGKKFAVICRREFYGPSVRQEIVPAHGGTDKALLFDSPRAAREWIAEMEEGLVLESGEYRRSYQVTTVGSARWEKLGGRA